MDVVTLSRIQFALNISFHYIFPPISVGLGLILVLMEGCYLWTKNPVYERITKFWVKIFALVFAIGVGTGIVMVFAFGNNWSNFSKYVGDVFGSILGAEGIFAFFLESGFLGILLFGWKRVGPKMHFFSTIMVAFGAHFSAVWIVFANSWMQTPAGHKIVVHNGMERAVMDNFWQVLFNPSALDRLTHVLLGCWLTGAFLVLSVSCYYLLRGKYIEFALRSFKIALWVAVLGVILQLVSGDSSARGVAKNQPIKLAAFEGLYTTSSGPTSMYLGGIVFGKERKVRGIEIPGALTLLVHRNLKEPIPGLDQYPPELWPRVPVVFQTYHIMVMMWGLMFLGVLLALIAIKRKKLLTSRFTLWFLVFSVLYPQIANQAGWFSAEMGRQPWAVQGLLKTKDAASPIVTAGQVIASITLYSFVYLLIFVLFIYLLNKKIKSGPDNLVEATEYRDMIDGAEGTL